MARLRWRRYRRYRRYPRRFRRRGYRRGRVINRSSRSRVKVNFMGENFIDVGWPANSATSSQVYVSPFYQNVTPIGNRYVPMFPGALVSQASFLTFASCYEQCRLIGCKVIITVNTPVGASQNFTDVTMYSSIVRQFSLYDMEHNMLPFATIAASASSKRVTFVNNTVNKFGRACYASDLQERIDFVDSSSTYPTGTEVTPRYPDGTTLNDQDIACLHCATDLDSNVCHPKFCPVFVFQGNTSDIRGSARTLKLLVRITGTFEFRGPRFGAAAASASKVAPAADAKLPPVEGGDVMDVVLPDDPSQPTTKRAKLDEDDDDVCLPEDERSPPAPLPDDEDEDVFDRFDKAPRDDKPAYDPQWRKQWAAAGKPPAKPISGRQFASAFLNAFVDRNKDGKISGEEVARFIAPLRAIPRPVMDRLLAKALEEDEPPPPDPMTEKYGATAAAETEEEAKNVSTGGTPQK